MNAIVDERIAIESQIQQEQNVRICLMSNVRNIQINLSQIQNLINPIETSLMNSASIDIDYS